MTAAAPWRAATSPRLAALHGKVLARPSSHRETAVAVVGVMTAAHSPSDCGELSAISSSSNSSSSS